MKQEIYILLKSNDSLDGLKAQNKWFIVWSMLGYDNRKHWLAESIILHNQSIISLKISLPFKIYIE